MNRFASSLAARSTLVAVLLSSIAPLGCAGGKSAPKSPSGSSYSTGYGGGGPGGTAGESSSGGGGDEGGAIAAPTTAAAPTGGSWDSSPTSTGSTAGAGVATPSTPPPPAPPPVAKSPVPMAEKKGEAKPSTAADSVGTSTTITTTTTVIVNPPVIPTLPPPAYPDDQGSPTGGILTAAIWDDSIMRSQFVTFLGRYPSFSQQWGLDLSKKITIVVDDSNGVAVGDAPLSLRTPSGAVVNLRTHGDGTALFFPTASMQLPSYVAAPNGPNGQGGKAQLQTTYALAAQVGTLRTETSFPIPSGDTTWTVKLTGVPVRAATPALDVAVVLDTTGSMGDEISYLQNELVGVMKRVKKEQAMRRVRLGLVLYKDRGDEYVTKDFPFTEDLDVFLSELKQASAMGGGDMPESVNAALSDAVNNMQWAGDETGRVALLVADAPPHFYADEQYTYKQEIWDFAAKGIKIIPVAASGIDKGTEYVFRSMAAFTGGRYTFLTDDSGVGDTHLIPDITGYQVEHLDKILVRVIRDEANAFAR